VGDVLEDVQAGDPLCGQQLCCIGFVLLQRRREHVSRLHFLPPGALNVKDRRLQDPAKRQRLLRLFLLPP
jgi:hypothetical protein